MRDESYLSPAGQRARLAPRVELARGHWHREEAGGSVRTAGWWESVTVTWPAPAPDPARAHPLLRHAAVTAIDAMAPVLAGLAAAGAQRLITSRFRPAGIGGGASAVRAAAARALPAARRALPAARPPD
jgi:hypothetical protein